ncbi:hypothetical protein F3Y22_tig00112127pilonHSYRG00086 [Hibiscus syriacus]|uniref:Reverse transcriptase domain-containing protein n=1 Tax=Hibiscus syriacus TaxID=106335 RepID=A0A6A2XUN2_HIBSY|nr:hypothetical protein F3Y22_tig00112127pilonHSYRG00086 [Hibiscus syriacus]
MLWQCLKVIMSWQCLNKHVAVKQIQLVRLLDFKIPIALRPWGFPVSGNSFYATVVYAIPSGSGPDNWNKSVFGFIGVKKRTLMARIRGIQKATQARSSAYLSKLESDLLIELEILLDQEEVIWMQKSRLDRVLLGDRNTKYFHRRDIGRKQRNRISSLKIDDGDWCNDDTTLKEVAINFFTNIFTGDSNNAGPFPISGVFPFLDPTLFMTLDSFIQKQWGILGPSVCRIIQRIFGGIPLERALNNTIIVLIPKRDHPKSFANFRPISLCMVIYKLISKIFVRRLKPLFPLLIRDNQTSFITGRSVMENIIVNQEVIQSMRSLKTKKGWMTIKVDLEKAFDRLEWNFIAGTLLDAGLPSGIRRIIMDNITSTRHLINFSVSTEDWEPFRFVKNGSPLSHLFFADDLILYSRAVMTHAKIIKDTLTVFGNSSGHHELDCLGKYLGILVLHRRTKCSNYDFILDKIRNRISGWAARFLTMAGRIVLANSTLLAILVYFMQPTMLPKRVCLDIEKLVPSRSRGLGLRKVNEFNVAFILKIGFALITNANSLWTRLLHEKYMMVPSLGLLSEREVNAEFLFLDFSIMDFTNNRGEWDYGKLSRTFTNDQLGELLNARNDYVLNISKVSTVGILRKWITWAMYYHGSHVPPISPVALQQPAKWMRPNPGWLCLNVDVAISSTTGISSVGGHFWDHRGTWISGFQKSIGIVSTIQVEPWAILIGLQCDQKEGFEMVQIQSGCAKAVDMVNNPNASRNPLSLVRLIDAIRCSARATNVVWTPRECNKPADYLARTATPHSLELICLSLPPAEVISLLEQDSVAAPLLQ